MIKLKFHTLAEAEAATEAARRCYEALVIEAAQKVGSKAELSRVLGYKSVMSVHNTISSGKFSAIRRMANACKEKGLI